MFMEYRKLQKHLVVIIETIECLEHLLIRSGNPKLVAKLTYTMQQKIKVVVGSSDPQCSRVSIQWLALLG